MIHIKHQDIDNLRRVSRGGFGIVYQVDEDTAYKIYTPTVLDYNDKIIPNPALSRPIRKVKGIISKDKSLKHTDLLKDIVYIDGKFGGIAIPYYDGTLLKRLKDESFELKRDIAFQVIRNASELDRNLIYPTDYKLTNMMWVNNQVKFIDLDDTRTLYMKRPSKSNSRICFLRIDHSLKEFFHETKYKPYTFEVENQLGHNPWLITKIDYNGLLELLKEKEKPHKVLLANSNSDLDTVRNFIHSNDYDVWFTYDKKVLDDEYFIDVINTFNRNGIDLYNFICRTDINDIFSDYNVKDCLSTKEKTIIKR